MVERFVGERKASSPASQRGVKPTQILLYLAAVQLLPTSSPNFPGLRSLQPFPNTALLYKHTATMQALRYGASSALRQTQRRSYSAASSPYAQTAKNLMIVSLSCFRNLARELGTPLYFCSRTLSQMLRKIKTA